VRWPGFDALLIAAAAAFGAAGCGAPDSPPATSAGAGQEPGPEKTAERGGDATAPGAGATADPAGAGGSSSPAGGSAAAPSASPSETATPAARNAPPEPPPLTESERKDMERTCKPLVQALNAAMRKSPAKSPGASRQPAAENSGRADAVEVLKQVLAKPPKMAAADRERCAVLLERSIREYQAAMIQTEARTVVEMLARRVMSSYLENKKLCPSSPPVPSKVAAVTSAPFVSTSADWDAPGWKCLGFDFAGQTQRFQYEVVSDAGGQSFEVIARGAPMQGGGVVEFFQRGALKSGKIELGPFTKR
jgi:hypothetical protein